MIDYTEMLTYDLGFITCICIFTFLIINYIMKVPLFVAQTEWIEPEEYPDLRSYDEIAVDLETRDPDLKSKGSGSVIGNGEVVGIAVAVPGRKFYFPIAHGSGPNMDRKRTLEWFKDILSFNLNSWDGWLGNLSAVSFRL